MFGLIGYTLSNFYLYRKKFFFNLDMFVKAFKMNVNFSSKKLIVFIDDYIKNVHDKSFSQLLLNFKNAITMNSSFDYQLLFHDINILNKHEKESVFQLFSKLGRVNVLSQNDYIDGFLDISAEFYNSSKNESIKYSSLYTKLGIILGVLLVIIIY